jgi:hypothetical protein
MASVLHPIQRIVTEPQWFNETTTIAKHGHMHMETESADTLADLLYRGIKAIREKMA